MPLTSGTKLGPYEVVGLLGAGGMGEVYRARDTRVDRTVALKVLPEGHQRKCPEALAQAEISERRIAGGAAPLSRSWLGVAYAMCGETARARQKLDELHALEAKQYVDPVNFADIHRALGETD